jgi:hypothetical protein
MLCFGNQKKALGVANSDPGRDTRKAVENGGATLCA